MKYLIMCEGANEKKIIELLLENGRLRVEDDDLLGRIVYHARQIGMSPMVMGQLRIYGGDVEIWRIGDKQTDQLREYVLRKSQKRPKAFAKENIAFHGRKYKGDTDFYEAYYGRDIDKLVAAIREYKQRNHSHKNEEHYLSEILKD